MTKQKKIRVMFVCIGNACRSPMAEAIARQDAADILEVCSAGLMPMGYIPELTLQTLTNNGYSTEGLDSKPIDMSVLLEMDLVLNLSGFASPATLAKAAQLEDWPVADPYGEDGTTYQAIFEEIRGRIENLAERLRKERIREKVKR